MLLMSIHRTDINIFRFDPETYQIFQRLPNVTTSLVSTDILRIPLRASYQFVKGDQIVVIYGLTGPTIALKYTTDVTIPSIAVNTSWSFALYGFRATRLTIIDYHVKLHDELWLSTGSGCMHFIGAQEYINLSNSKCHLTADDELNVHKVYLLVEEVINSTTLVLKATNLTDAVNVGDGRC